MLNESEPISPVKPDKTDWIRHSVLFWSSLSDSRNTINDSPLCDVSPMMSLASSSNGSSSLDIVAEECRQETNYSFTEIAHQVRELEQNLQTNTFDISSSGDDTLDFKTQSPHLTLEFPMGSSIKSNPLYLQTEQGQKDYSGSSCSDVLSLDYHKHNKCKKLHNKAFTSRAKSQQHDYNKIEESVKLVQDTLDEISRAINKDMKIERDPDEALRNLLLKIKPPKFNTEDDISPRPKEDCYEKSTCCKNVLLSESNMMKTMDGKLTSDEKPGRFRVKPNASDLQCRDRLDSGLQSIGSESNSPHPSPGSQHTNLLRHIQEEYDSGYSDITRMKKEIFDTMEHLEARNSKKHFNKRDCDSDWSPISTLSSTYNSKTSTMERSRSYSVPAGISAFQIPGNTHSMSTGRLRGNNVTSSDDSTEMLYSDNELKAIRKFLSLTSQYFDDSTKSNRWFDECFEDPLITSLPSINKAIESQTRELQAQRVKQEDFLHQLGDMLLEIVSLKEEQTTVRTKQAKALGLLKRQLDILKKHQSKSHNDVLNEVTGLKEKLSQSSSEILLNCSLSSECNSTQTVNCSSSKGQLIWKVKDVMKKLTRIKSGLHEELLISHNFHTSEYGYKMSAWLYLNGRDKMANKYVSLYVCVVLGEYDAILPWPIKPTYTFTLMDQRSDISKRNNHCKDRRVFDIANKGVNIIAKQGGIPRPTDSSKALIVGFDDFIDHEHLLEHRYLLDDTLFIRIDATLHH